jgi:hypothetical protein
MSLDPPSRHSGKYTICSTAEFSDKPLGLGSAYRGPLYIPLLGNGVVDHALVCRLSILTKRPGEACNQGKDTKREVVHCTRKNE